MFALKLYDNDAFEVRVGNKAIMVTVARTTPSHALIKITGDKEMIITRDKYLKNQRRSGQGDDRPEKMQASEGERTATALLTERAS
jgi:hypothetical protein